MALVNKVKSPICMFSYNKQGKGTNFKALEKDVESFGGSVVESEDSSIVSVNVFGVVSAVPLGYALIFEDGNPKLMSVDVAEELYKSATESTEDFGKHFSSIDKRIKVLESKLESLEAKLAGGKS